MDEILFPYSDIYKTYFSMGVFPSQMPDLLFLKTTKVIPVLKKD